MIFVPSTYFQTHFLRHLVISYFVFDNSIIWHHCMPASATGAISAGSHSGILFPCMLNFFLFNGKLLTFLGILYLEITWSLGWRWVILEIIYFYHITGVLPVWYQYKVKILWGFHSFTTTFYQVSRSSAYKIQT